jgi:hypothetical protein
MRIFLASVTESIPKVMEDALNQNFRKVCRPSTELTIEPISPALTRLTDLSSSYGRLLNTTSFCRSSLKAQQEGFDAIVTT